jgi:hypothetical protein
MCNSIYSDNAKVNDRSNNCDCDNTSENDNNNTRRVMAIVKCDVSG